MPTIIFTDESNNSVASLSVMAHMPYDITKTGIQET